MLISGVVVVTKTDKTSEVLNALQDMRNVTTYGIHKDYHIVAVLEGNTARELEDLTEEIKGSIPGVLGVYPTYVNFELEDEEAG